MKKHCKTLSFLSRYILCKPVITVSGLSVIFILGLLFVGCSTQTTNKNTGKTLLSFSFWGSSEELTAINQVVNKFETEHPEIDIQPIHIPDNYFQKLHILMASNLTPDVMMLNSFYVPVYAEAHKLLPLPLNPHSKNGRAFFPQALKALSYKNHVYAYPRDISDLVVYVNMDLLKQAHIPLPKPNWTMSDLLTHAKRISTQHDTYGISFSDKPLFWLPYVWSFGGSLTKLDSTQSCQGLQFYADLVNRYHVAPSPKQIGSQGMSQLFANGQLGFFVSGRWSTPFLRKSAAFHWDVLPFPSGSHGSIVGIDASGYAVSAETDKKKAAQLFANYLTQSPSLKALTTSGLILPARIKLAQSALFLKQHLPPKHAQFFISAITHGQSTHVPSNWNEISEALGLKLAPLWEGKTKACELLPRAVNELKTEYGNF